MSISTPLEAITEGPKLQRKHVDGPVIYWAGHMHWLSLRERVSLWLGRSSIQSIAAKHWPHLARLQRDLAARDQTP